METDLDGISPGNIGKKLETIQKLSMNNLVKGSKDNLDTSNLNGNKSKKNIFEVIA
jgi:hypothetical protein